MPKGVYDRPPEWKEKLRKASRDYWTRKKALQAADPEKPKRKYTRKESTDDKLSRIHSLITGYTLKFNTMDDQKKQLEIEMYNEINQIWRE